MRRVLWHLTIVNGDAHNLAHRKSLKGLVNYNKYHNISFLKKYASKLRSTKYTKWGLLVQMTKVPRDHNTST